jgi:hypothetical protein
MVLFKKFWRYTMLVTEAITLLKNAELKQLAIKDDKEAVLGFINLGVLELHKRFRLLTGVVNFTMGSTPDYRIGPNNPGIPDFNGQHQVVQIERVEADDVELPINSPFRADSVSIRSYDLIHIPKQEEGTEITVYYRAAPINLVDVDLAIQLPPQFMEALFNYVGYRGHSSVKGDLKSENSSHYQRFEQSCKNIIFQGLDIIDNLESDKFTTRGFA